MSDGTVPVAVNPAITAIRITKTGSGMMPILKSTIDHQPLGQKPSPAPCRSKSALPTSCTHFLPVFELQGNRYESARYLISLSRTIKSATRQIDRRNNSTASATRGLDLEGSIGQEMTEHGASMLSSEEKLPRQNYRCLAENEVDQCVRSGLFQSLSACAVEGHVISCRFLLRLRARIFSEPASKRMCRRR